MTIHCRSKRIIRRGVATALTVLCIGWLVMEAGQWLFRIRAEALLADIRSLELNRSSWTDAERLMARWGRWGGWYGSCDANDCRYKIMIVHLSLVSPDFVLAEGPHLGGRVLELVGLRSAVVTASFHVVHGVVTNKGFGMDVALPISKWITPGGGFWLKADRVGGTYWPSLDVAAFEGAKLRGSTPFQIAKHPNHGFVRRRIRLEASFTPEESLAEQTALMDFHFDCITRWTACAGIEEILPRAEEEFVADGRDPLPLAVHRFCFPTLDVRAREEEDVLLADVLQDKIPEPAIDDSWQRGSWVQLMRSREVLKGHAPVTADGNFRVVVSCNDGQEKCSRPLPHSQAILTGSTNTKTPDLKTWDFDARGCGVTEATDANLAATRAGVQQDFGPRY